MIEFMFSCIVVVVFFAIFGTLIGNLIRLLIWSAKTFWPMVMFGMSFLTIAYICLLAFYN